jgi:hypothetical protein
MSDASKPEKPIVRYSELVRETPNATDRPARQAPPQPPADELSFRGINGLKGVVPAPSQTVTVHQIIPNQESGELFQRTIREVNLIYDAARKGRPFQIDPMFSLARAIVDHPTPDGIISPVFQGHQQAFDSDLNAVHCAILATHVARGLRFGPDDLVQLVVAALLHDIGAQKLPEELLKKPGKLTADEIRMMQTHPELGHRLLSEQGSQYPWLAQIVRQEHEREDGQGYPNGLLSESILEAAKVIGVTDIYEALTAPRPYRRTFAPHEAVKELLDCQERMGYARHVVRALIQQLSLFPAGCWVKLSSQEIGRVIRTNSRSPLRPAVEVLYSNDGRPVDPPRLVDLNENPLLHIVTSLSPNDRPASAPTEANAT